MRPSVKNVVRKMCMELTRTRYKYHHGSDQRTTAGEGVIVRHLTGD